MADLKQERMLRQLRSEIVASAVRLGVSPGVARMLAGSVEHRMELMHGGLDCKAARNRQILREFNGRNHAEVCRRWNISRRTLYRILGGGEKRRHPSRAGTRPGSQPQ